METFTEIISLVLFISVHSQQASGCGNKDFKYSKELMADTDATTYMTAFYQQQNCYVDLSLTE